MFLDPTHAPDGQDRYLIGDVLTPIPMSAGQSKREDYEYEKKGSCTVFMAFEPGTGQRWVQVYKRRRALEYKKFMEFVAKQFPRAELVRVVQDNLNTHQAGSFYTHLEPAKAFKLTKRFEFHFTPKHASWLNMVELEFSALSKQCLDRRIASMDLIEAEVNAWVADRNEKRVSVDWQFSVGEARVKLARHYKGASKLD